MLLIQWQLVAALALFFVFSSASVAANPQNCDPEVVCLALHADNKDLRAELRSLNRIEKENPRSELQTTISECIRERRRLSSDLVRRTQELTMTKRKLGRESEKLNTLSEELELLRNELSKAQEEESTCRQSERAWRSRSTFDAWTDAVHASLRDFEDAHAKSIEWISHRYAQATESSSSSSSSSSSFSSYLGEFASVVRRQAAEITSRVIFAAWEMAEAIGDPESEIRVSLRNATASAEASAEELRARVAESASQAAGAARRSAAFKAASTVYEEHAAPVIAPVAKSSRKLYRRMVRATEPHVKDVRTWGAKQGKRAADVGRKMREDLVDIVSTFSLIRARAISEAGGRLKRRTMIARRHAGRVVDFGIYLILALLFILLLPTLARIAVFLVRSGLGLAFSIVAILIFALTCGLCCRGYRPSKAARAAKRHAEKKKKAQKLRRSKRTGKRVNNVENPTVHNS